MLKSLWDWLIKNLSNLFGIIGVALTVYFGVFYVPDWIKDSKSEKVNTAKKDIEQSLKELIFSDSTVHIREIQSLIEAKEIDLNDKFPYSLIQVLTLTQESFMQDKYLPLSKRKDLINKLEKLKSTIPKAPLDKKSKEKEGYLSIIPFEAILSVAVSIFAASLGLFSLFNRQKREAEAQEELRNEIEQNEFSFNDQSGDFSETDHPISKMADY